jgi:hypothetical protein
MVLMYPEPTVFSKHTVIPTTLEGEKLGEALLQNPVLQQIAAEYGFRTGDPRGFKTFVTEHGLAVMDPIVNVAEPPTFMNTEKMIQQIEIKYQ